MSGITDIQKRFLANFELFEQSLNGETRHPVHKLRRPAIERFEQLGIPTLRDESWRFTNLQPLAEVPFAEVGIGEHTTVSEAQLRTAVYMPGSIDRLVFVNGHYDADLSAVGELPEGAIVAGLAHAMKSNADLVEQHLAAYDPVEADAFTALNTAFLRDGAFIYVPDGVQLERPVHVVYVTTATEQPISTHPRNLFVAGAKAGFTVVEEYGCLDSDVRCFTNPVTEISAAEDAHVRHYRLQNECAPALHIGALYGQQKASSTITSLTFTFGSQLVRNTSGVILDGEGAHCTMDGLYIAGGTQLVDNHTLLDHAVPNCTSHELFKGILDDRARGVFAGRIIVREDAQKTDSKQSNRNLLLSDDAVIDTMPQLEIFADDVKCTHGATVGELDENQIYYLRARGIALDEARAMLTFAFAEELVEQVELESLRSHLNTLIVKRLDRNDAAHKALSDYAGMS